MPTDNKDFTEDFLAKELEDDLAKEFVKPMPEPVRKPPLAPPPPSDRPLMSYAEAQANMDAQARKRGGTNTTNHGHMPVRQGSVKGYEALDTILGKAYSQAAAGKGKERHAMSPVGFQPWEQQPILANARQVGPGGLAQQVMKKAGESTGMAGRKDFEAAKAEALGAIVYAAALYKLYEEMEAVT